MSEIEIAFLKKTEQLKAIMKTHKNTETKLKGVLKKAQSVALEEKRELFNAIETLSRAYDEEKEIGKTLKEDVARLKALLESKTKTRTLKKLCKQSFLSRNEYIKPNSTGLVHGVNRLYIDNDLKLVMTHKGNVIWKDDNQHISFGLNDFGDIVNNYLSGRTKTYSSEDCGERLALTANGDLTLLNADGTTCWSLKKRNYPGECEYKQCETNKLFKNQTLYIGDSIHYGSNILYLNGHGNLILQSNEKQIWASNTQDALKFTFDDNGLTLSKKRVRIDDVVILWEVKRTNAHVLEVQRNGNLVLKDVNGLTLWQTNTAHTKHTSLKACSPPPDVRLQIAQFFFKSKIFS